MKVNNKEKIINLLKNEEHPISGELISNRLGISRTGVWKHIKNLSNQGYKIESSHTGYHLKKEEDILLPYEFNNPENIYYKYTTESTMTTSWELIKSGKATNQMVIIAEEQTAIVTKKNRDFNSPKGGLYFSLILKPQCPLSEINIYPIALSIAVNNILNSIDSGKYNLKWPLENCFSENKVSGIIHEYITEGNSCTWIILGVGINKKFKTPRKELLSRIVEETMNILNIKEQVLEIYKSKLNILNKKIKIISEGNKLMGRVLDINQNGTIVLQSENGLQYGFIGNSKLEEIDEY